MSSKLLKQSSLYSFGKLFAFIASLISFPILTKSLSVGEYGSIALLTVTTGLLNTFIKFGVQQSIIRFKHDLTRETFSSNIVFLAIATLLVTVPILIVVGKISQYFTDILIFQYPFFYIILISSALQALQSFGSNLLVTSEHSLAVTILGIAYKIMSLSTMLIAILIISATAESFIFSVLIADFLYFLLLIAYILKKQLLTGFSLHLIDKKLIYSFLLFGIPMFGFELSNMFHAFADRFLIKFYLGSEQLGLYSVSYNMGKMITELILSGLLTAMLPQIFSLWKNEGEKATSKLLTNINDLIILFFPILLAGIYTVSADLIGLLTTEAYASHAYLLPIIFAGTFIAKTGLIYSSGLQIKKDSMVMLRIVIESALINLILNIIFIPKFGIISAAINTVLSYLWTSVRFYFQSNKFLKIKFNWKLLIRSSLYAIAMFFSINFISYNFISYNSTILTLTIKVLIGGFIAAILIFVFELEVRKKIISLIRQRLDNSRNSNSQ